LGIDAKAIDNYGKALIKNNKELEKYLNTVNKIT